MKSVFFVTAFSALAFAMPALAAGDAAKGEKEFGKCKACHAITTPDGEVIVKGGRTGPDLHGVVGKTAGTSDFKFGASLVEAGEKGLVWDEENLLEYILDPAKFLKAYLDDSKAKSNMTFKLKRGREDIVAFLASVSPEADED